MECVEFNMKKDKPKMAEDYTVAIMYVQQADMLFQMVLQTIL